MIHNAYGRRSGEEVVVGNTEKVLSERGHEVLRFQRSSEEIPQLTLGKTRAFLSGIYNPFSQRQFRHFCTESQPDLVHVHNIYPLLSASVLVEARQQGLPVVMTVHNYRFTCPTGLHLSKGEVCERCVGGNEFWCVVRNCTGSLPKSIGYAARNAAARQWSWFGSNVTRFIALTEFQRQRMDLAGLDLSSIDVIPNMVEMPTPVPNEEAIGGYVGFVGRVSTEKGIATLLRAATRLPSIPFKLAGRIRDERQWRAMAPDNVEFIGELSQDGVSQFYQDSRLIVLPSIWFEGLPMSAIEAMLHGKAIVASDIGGIPAVVESGRTGQLVPPGDERALADSVGKLWNRSDLLKEYGAAGREKALREYNADRYYERLLATYRAAIRDTLSTGSC